MRIVKLVFLSFVLNGCGGGGSNESETGVQLTNRSPYVDAGLDVTSNELELLTLNATATDPEGDKLDYNWTRISGNNSSLNGANTLTPSIQLHNVKEVSVEEYKLTVIDSHGAMNSDNVVITINPINTLPTYTVNGDTFYEEYNWIHLYVVFLDPDADGRVISGALEQIAGPELNLPYEYYEGSIGIQFTAPQVTEKTTFEYIALATDDEGGITQAPLSFTIDKRPAQVITKMKGINDTGITSCSNGFTDDLPCPVSGIPNQDAENGRDKLSIDGLLTKVGSGKAGFDYTKLDHNGQPITSDSAQWSCVLDNQTGLIWEVKLNDADSFRDKNRRLRWYNPYQDQNGGFHGAKNVDNCIEYCNTQEYIQAINSLKLCGIDEWTLPSVTQLRTIVDYSIVYPGPTIDEYFFPNANVDRDNYFLTWASETSLVTTDAAYGIVFDTGVISQLGKEAPGFIRLVTQQRLKDSN